MQCPCGYTLFWRDEELTVAPSAERFVALPLPCCSDDATWERYVVEVRVGYERLLCKSCQRVRSSRPIGGGSVLHVFVSDAALYAVVSDVANPEGVFGRFTSLADPSVFHDVPARLVRAEGVGALCVVDHVGTVFVTEDDECIVADEPAQCVTYDAVMIDNAGAWLTASDDRLIVLEPLGDCGCEKTETLLVDEQALVLTTEGDVDIALDAVTTCANETLLIDESGIGLVDEVGKDVVLDYSVQTLSANAPAQIMEYLPMGAVVAEWAYEIAYPDTAVWGEYSVVLHDRLVRRLQDLGRVTIGP
jgi:hypothetical protein